MTKAKIVNILVMLAEGPASVCGKWRSASDMEEVKGLLRGFRTMLADAAGYFKVDFEITYDNDDSFSGTMLISPHGNETLEAHLEHYFDKVTHTFKIANAHEKNIHMKHDTPVKIEYWKNFINTHEIAA